MRRDYVKKMFLTTLAAVLCATVMAQMNAPAELKPLPYYGKVAQEVVKRLERKHVLRRQFDDEMSRRAWTNLVSSYDFSRMVFLKSDIDGFSTMERGIDDAVARGDVSFVYDMHKVFLRRIADRVNYVTNLLLTTEFDFSVDEDYTWKRKDAEWPETVAEQDELWRKRIKNEMLSIVLGRQLDKEEADREEAEKAKRPKTEAPKGKAEDRKDD